MKKLKRNTKIWLVSQKKAGESKYRNKKKEERKQKTNNNIVDQIPNMLMNKCIVINTLIKRQGLPDV